MPVDNLVSNWAYMVMASLAWTLKAWFALSLPETGRWKDKHQAEKESVLKMEFKRFLNAFMRVPCQIVRQAGGSCTGCWPGTPGNTCSSAVWTRWAARCGVEHHNGMPGYGRPGWPRRLARGK